MATRGHQIAAGSARDANRMGAEWSTVTGEAVPPRRRRRRAVWRAGAGISRAETTPLPDADADPDADPATDPDAAPDVQPDAAPDVRPDVEPSAATAATLAASDEAGETEPQPSPRPAPRRRRGDPSERGLRDLVGSGPSQLGPVRAMRARDLNRPTDEDLADADQNVVLVRRHWKPPKS